MSYAKNAAGRDGHLHLKLYPRKIVAISLSKSHSPEKISSGVGEEFRRAFYPGVATGLRNVPTPLTVTSTTSPAASGPTPEGVPVAMTSPGRSVIIWDIH